MKYAYNDNNTLRDVVMANPFHIFQPGYASLFIEVPDECQTGWILENGQWVEPPEPKEVVPSVVTMRQCRLQLNAIDKLTVVDSAVKAQGGAALIEWEYATDVERSNPLVSAIAELFEWGETDLDEMFLAASRL